VEADHVDGVGRHIGFREELAHREDMAVGEHRLGLDDVGALARLLEAQRQRRRLAQLLARLGAIGVGAEGDRADMPGTIGFDQRGIDPVERGARHQPHGQHLRHPGYFGGIGLGRKGR
jgi:hypothetical protein